MGKWVKLLEGNAEGNAEGLCHVAPASRVVWREAQQDLEVFKASHRQERNKPPSSPINV